MAEKWWWRMGMEYVMAKVCKKSFRRTRMVSTLDKVVVSEVYTFVKTHLIYTLNICIFLMLHLIIKIHIFLMCSLIKHYHN